MVRRKERASNRVAKACSVLAVDLAYRLNATVEDVPMHSRSRSTSGEINSSDEMTCCAAIIKKPVRDESLELDLSI